jgi:hypothetical protein
MFLGWCRIDGDGENQKKRCVSCRADCKLNHGRPLEHRWTDKRGFQMTRTLQEQNGNKTGSKLPFQAKPL